MEGDDLASSIGISILTAGTIETLIVEGNATRGFRRGLYSYVEAGYFILQSVIASNIFATGASGTEGIYVNAGTDGNNRDITVTGNTVTGTLTRAFWGANEEGLLLVGNNFKGSVIEKTATNFVDANNLV